MALSDFDVLGSRRQAQRSAAVQRVQVMLVAACIASLGVVGVAGALLTNLF